ncbi:class I SAM-dependent methyltransferase [Alteriqipengyuania lutimaris]|uniref:Class I SAM-dependent methyltransferase n=1 Tax=Alteriqipengyuania lutimaris TaxID=1538146 RepID=A0A395LIB9_9SPHN|nr:class I SAM-dependent methyltransferase [Alteriqipengyuania lutimaris]MBB3034382.1 2-polyprenyl-3-methyl-5-hydroxy-6-metoxy-1,4-benzoquinol methylase [Alteriqipengyuania lutimaris]RDS76716.1 class I SAM-dependent methyltransferase [Alteriqipengyuania lutimaris]
MMHTLQDEQKVQESWYSFPYHYVSALPPQFGVARTYDWCLNYVSAITFLLDRIGAEESRSKIIDIGCGDGRLTHELAKRFPDSQLTGIDYSAQAIGLARALNSGANLRFEARDLIADPIEADNDAAALMEVYEHIEPSKADAFLRGVRDTLRPGGVLHLTVPHVNQPLAPHHFRHFTSSVLAAEISQYFEIEELKPFERISGKRRWMNRLLMNRFFVLNHQGALNAVFRHYMKTMFHCEGEDQCQRLYLRAIRR